MPVNIKAKFIDEEMTDDTELAALELAIQNQIDGKEPTIIGAATSITQSDLATSRAVVSNASGKIEASATTSTEVGHLSGVTSAIQTQLDTKEPEILSGLTTQYWRGDKTFQTLNKAAVGLSNVDNVSAADLRTRSTHTGNETVLSWNESSTPTTPSVGVSTYVKDVGGRQMFAQIGKSGIDYSFQPFFARNAIFCFKANGNTTATTVFGGATPTANGTATTRNVVTTNFFTWMRRIGYVSATTGNATCGLRSTALQFGRGNGAGRGGFHFVARFGISDATLVAGARLFVGLTSSTGVLGNADPSTFTNIIGVGLDAADTNLQIMHNDAGGSATKIDLGASFPESTVTDFYELSLYCPPNGIDVSYQVINLSTNASASGVISTNLPISTQLLTWQIWRHNVATGLAVGVDVASVYIETDN